MGRCWTYRERRRKGRRETKGVQGLTGRKREREGAWGKSGEGRKSC